LPPKKIFDPERRPKPMRVACFMSGSGTNVVKILENRSQRGSRCPYKVILVFSDVFDPSNQKCKAQLISSQHGVDYKCNDIMGFYRRHGQQTKRDLSLRPQYDRVIADLIAEYDLDLVALCGYMSILTTAFLGKYEAHVVNVHPADLSVKEADKRKYTGINAVGDAILAGERTLHSTTHVVRPEVDYGEILMRSPPIEVILPEGLSPHDLRKGENTEILKRIVAEHQARLKEEGDWVIYPKTLEMIGEGRYALDGQGNVYVDDVLMPNGFRL
jgi:folate-dependent phosphoribosylglycinamide formyltransferase PurN